MGEIYRSVSVTGTRTLLAQRVERVVNDKAEKPTVAQNVDREGPRARNKGQSPADKLHDAEASAVVAEQALPDSTAVTQQHMQDDLLTIQQRHLDQLEGEKRDLEGQLDNQAEELREATQSLSEWMAAEESRGYAEGHEKAAREVGEQNEQKLAQLGQAMALFDETLHAQVQQVDKYAVELAFAALARIVGEQCSNTVFTKAVVEEALASVKGSSKVVVRISQSDLDVLESIRGDLATAGQFSELQLVADPRVSVGGCLIETDNGTWDARLETQLLRLKDTVEQSLKKQKETG